MNPSAQALITSLFTFRKKKTLITIIVIASYMCSNCNKFDNATLMTLLDEFVASNHSVCGAADKKHYLLIVNSVKMENVKPLTSSRTRIDKLNRN